MRAIKITYTNETEGHQFGDEFIVLDDNTQLGADATMGEIYCYARREFGRCISKVYIDQRIPTNDKGGERWETRHVGWFFVKRDRYEDTNEPYLRGAWVTVGEYVPATEEHIVFA